MKTSRSYISFNVFTNSFKAMLLLKLEAPHIDLCRLMSSRCVRNKPVNRSASTSSQTRGRTDITDDDSENISTKFLSKHEFPDKLCGKNCHHVSGVTTGACVESKICSLSMYLKSKSKIPQRHKARLTPTTSVTSTAISPVKMSIGRKSLTNLCSEMIFLQGKPIFYIFLPSTPPWPY